jgi:K+-transporting ATPase A subunit
MFGLGFLMFTSAATGIAVAIAFIRGLTGRPLGNFYIDLTQSITRILLPISLIGATLFILLGVPETLAVLKPLPHWKAQHKSLPVVQSRILSLSSSWRKRRRLFCN